MMKLKGIAKMQPLGLHPYQINVLCLRKWKITPFSLYHQGTAHSFIRQLPIRFNVTPKNVPRMCLRLALTPRLPEYVSGASINLMGIQLCWRGDVTRCVITAAASLFPSFQSFCFEFFSRLGKVRHKTDDKKYNS